MRVYFPQVLWVVDTNERAELHPFLWICKPFCMDIRSHIVRLFIREVVYPVDKTFMDPSHRDSVNSVEWFHRRVAPRAGRMDHSLIILPEVSNDVPPEDLLP